MELHSRFISSDCSSFHSFYDTQIQKSFFDLDDTLWAFSVNARETFEEMYHKYNYERYFNSFSHFYELYERRNAELWGEYEQGEVTKEELNKQRFFYPLKMVGVNDEKLAKIFADNFLQLFLQKKNWSLTLSKC